MRIGVAYSCKAKIKKIVGSSMKEVVPNELFDLMR